MSGESSGKKLSRTFRHILTLQIISSKRDTKSACIDIKKNVFFRVLVTPQTLSGNSTVHLKRTASVALGYKRVSTLLTKVMKMPVHIIL